MAERLKPAFGVVFDSTLFGILLEDGVEIVDSDSQSDYAALLDVFLDRGAFSVAEHLAGAGIRCGEFKYAEGSCDKVENR